MKHIVLTDEAIMRYRKEFEEQLEQMRKDKIIDGELSFKRSLSADNIADKERKAVITFTPLAYIKMLKLIQHFSTEVAWHGVAHKTGDRAYLISDIIVYPQVVTGGTVNTDQEAYNKFMMELDDDTANNMRMQGHSHVNMQTTPSVVDTTHQAGIVSQLQNNDYYIFMIWNKRLEKTIIIYDMQDNIRYDTADVEVRVADDNQDINAFVSAADKLVQSPLPASDVKSASTKGVAKKKKAAEPAYMKNYGYPRSSSQQSQIDYDDFIFGNRYGYFE